MIKVLLVHHTYRQLPWGLPGGWMEYDQPENELERELYEETGLKIKIKQIVKALYGDNPHRDLILEGIFIDSVFKPSAEVSEYGFFKIGNWPNGMPNIQKELIENVISKKIKVDNFKDTQL